MTTQARLERDLPDILLDLAMGPTPDYVDDVLGRTVRMRQRPAWTSLERWIPVADIASRPAFAPRIPWRTIGVALVILALVIAGAVAVIGSRQVKLPAPFGPAANGLIAYASAGEIYVGDRLSGATQLILGGPEDDSGPSHSPDGALIGFIRTVSATEFDIYVMRPDGAELRRLTSAPIPDTSWAQWSPDSRSIAVIREVETTSSGCSTAICTTNQLEMLDVADGTVRVIATADGMSFVQFRPADGQELLYRALVDGAWGLFAMDVDGRNVRTIIEPTVPAEIDMAFSGAVYAADGKRIFYEHGDASGCCRLWTVNADGTDAHEFLPMGPAWDGQAIPSPDGEWISYWHNANDGGPHGITVVRADGTGPVIETGPALAGTAHWIWSPDSSTILMAPTDLGFGKAYLLDPEGGPWTTVPWESTGDLDWQRIAP
jgi:Tol biopolymer transport system component